MAPGYVPSSTSTDVVGRALVVLPSRTLHPYRRMGFSIQHDARSDWTTVCVAIVNHGLDTRRRCSTREDQNHPRMCVSTGSYKPWTSSSRIGRSCGNYLQDRNPLRWSVHSLCSAAELFLVCIGIANINRLCGWNVPITPSYRSK